MFGLREKKIEEIEPNLGPFMGFLGKIAAENDFVSMNSNSREVRVLDEAMRCFYSEVGSVFSPHEHKLQSVGFCLVGGGDRQGLAGYLYPSRDKAGRLYPFSAFLQLPDPDYYFRADWTLESSIEKIKSWFPDQSSFPEMTTTRWKEIQKDNYLNLNYPTARDTAKLSMTLAASIEASDWLAIAFGSEKSSWIQGLTCICKLLVQLRTGKLPSNADGFWLPLGSDNDSRYALMFWTQLCWSIFPKNTWRPDLLWVQNETAGKLFVLTRALTGRSLAQVSLLQSSHPSFLGWPELVGKLNPSEDALFLNPISKLFSNPRFSLLDLAIELRKLL